MRDSRTLLIVFATNKERQDMHGKLTWLLGSKTSDPNTPNATSAISAQFLGLVSAKMLTGYREEIWTAQRKWQAREISNVSLY